MTSQVHRLSTGSASKWRTSFPVVSSLLKLVFSYLCYMNSRVLFMRYEPSRIEIAGSSEVEEGMIWAPWNVLHTDSSPLWFAFSMILCIRSRKLVICPLFFLLGRQSECLFWSPFAQHHLVGFLFLFLFSRRMFVVKRFNCDLFCFVLLDVSYVSCSRKFPPRIIFLLSEIQFCMNHWSLDLPWSWTDL